MNKLSTYVCATAFGVAISATALAQGVKTPAASPTQVIKQNFALSSVEVAYSRPATKDRVIFGDLVPYGKVWRTGANNATKVTLGEELAIEGVKVPAGEYALYTIPNKNEWEIVLNKGVKNWGDNGYKQEDDVVRVKVKPQALPFKVESFMIAFDKIAASSMEMVIMWDKVAVPVRFTAPTMDATIMAQIAEAMKGDKKPYWTAASYYFDNNRDLKQALAWVDEAIKEAKEPFYMVHLKAKIQAKMGDKAAAKATAQRSIELAKAANNADYVALNEKLIKTL
ncbi:DUF2911 domain-containing protein [Chitinophaga sedimenti]|uniref:DUF2911 domain-containing protein n=1 Tax=Chitinophaga sedimenti TaxID=2033606 RepID=UPI0020046B28|nr:DUF2911 domain-containing protein [Chitinophaga sedimenti]MCK7555165.1 DUF2911 domain-containing protein [Chitinophaga sedimenti]